MNNKQIEIRRENGSDQARVEQDGKRVLKLGLDLFVDPDGKGLQTHWQKTVCSLLTGCIAHVLYRALKENHPATLPSVDQLLSDPDKKVVEVWTEMLANTYFHGDAHPLAASAARDQLNRPIEEAGSVLSTALSYLTLYRDRSSLRTFRAAISECAT